MNGFWAFMTPCDSLAPRLGRPAQLEERRLVNEESNIIGQERVSLIGHQVLPAFQSRGPRAQPDRDQIAPFPVWR